MNFGEERGAFGTSDDPAAMAAAMERWNQAMIDTVPSERLLVWDPKEGWEPLCEFLEVPVPDTPLPNVNDTENFQKNLIMGPAIDGDQRLVGGEPPGRGSRRQAARRAGGGIGMRLVGVGFGRTGTHVARRARSRSSACRPST